MSSSQQSTSRKIVIVGGVAGGASAATRARRVNETAEIVMLEKGKHVSFANCGLPYYIGGEIQDREDLLVADPETFRDWFEVDVRTGHQVRSIDRESQRIEVRDRQSDASYRESYDRLILSPGATPIVPPIDGTDARNVFTLRDLGDTDRIRQYLDEHEVNRTVVVGAGFIGLEMTEMFHHRGLDVALVELQDQVLPPLDPEMARFVQRELEKQGVEVYLDNGVSSFGVSAGGRVDEAVLQDGTRLSTDLVMLSIGVRPSTELAEECGLEVGPAGGIQVDAHLRTSDPKVYAVGDAVEYRQAVVNDYQRIPLAGPANRAGRIAGEHAATDRAPEMKPVLGTAIVRVFEQAAAITGFNEQQAQERDLEVDSVWIPGRDHAGYFPGARPLQLKVSYEPEDGRLIGAQVVGEAGVDKRIDVCASVIQMGGTTDDLASLDLAYSPPFGSAKDPIHMAGFAAQNQRRGLSRFDPPRTVRQPDGLQILDVRSQTEFEEGHLPGAVNIPLSELRDRLDRLDRSQRIEVVCGVGKRAYYALRILRSHGFEDVRVLGGGMRMQPLSS